MAIAAPATQLSARGDVHRKPATAVAELSLAIVNATDDEKQIKRALAAGEFTLTTPQWQHIDMGGARLSVPVNIYEQQE